MCSICGKNPCDCRCPNAEEPRIIGTCDNCEEELREDYTYYEDNEGNKFCNEKCAIEYHGIVEKP